MCASRREGYVMIETADVAELNEKQEHGGRDLQTAKNRQRREPD